MPFWVALRVFTTHAGAARPQSVPRCRRWVSYFSCSRHMFTLYFWSCTHLIGVWGIYSWFTKLMNVVKNLNANFREFLTRVFLVGAEIPMRCLVSSSISNMAAACVVMRAWGSQQAAWRPAGRPVTQLIVVHSEKCLILVFISGMEFSWWTCIDGFIFRLLTWLNGSWPCWPAHLTFNHTMPKPGQSCCDLGFPWLCVLKEN